MNTQHSLNKINLVGKLKSKAKNKGLTLVELMIASTLASMMSLGVLSIFVDQSGNITSEVQRDTTKQEAHRSFDTISRLIRQAQRSNLAVTFIATNGAQGAQPDYTSDSLIVDFTLPENQQIWPNTTGTDNAVRLVWSTTSDNEVKIQIANTATLGSLSSATLSTLAGSSSGTLPRISNMVFWPLSTQRTMLALQGNTLVGSADNGYLLQVTARAGTPDITYTNPDYTAESAFKHYRTYTVSGVVYPRN